MNPPRARRTPFDEHAERANREGFHNHRNPAHSDLITEGIVRDLVGRSPALKAHLEANEVGVWIGVGDGKGRGRRADLLIAKPRPAEPKKSKAKKKSESTAQRTLIPLEGDEKPFDLLGAARLPDVEPDVKSVRVFMEHKSTLTAHRNKTNRQDDLNNLSQQVRSDAGVIAAATVMVGTAPLFLNVAQGVKPLFYDAVRDAEGRLIFEANGDVKTTFREAEFTKVVERIRARDPTLVDEFWRALSGNGPKDWHGSVEHYRQELRPRPGNERHIEGYDGLLIVPVDYSNLAPCRVHRDNDLGIDHDAEYEEFIDHLATLYTHLYGGPAPRQRPPPRKVA